MMTAADIPAIPAQAVEVCEHVQQTVCPIVAGVPAMWVTVPNTLDGWPDLYGRIVRFQPTPAGEPGAWVRLASGGQMLFPLRELTLVAGEGAR